MNCASDHSGDTPRQEALYHFYVGLVLGLIAIVGSALLHQSAPVAALNRIGEDRAQRLYVEHVTKGPTQTPLVLLDFIFPRGAAPETDRLARAIRTLAQHRPKAIIVDQDIDAPDPSSFIAAVQQAAGLGIDVVLTPSLDTVGIQSGRPIPIVPGGIDTFYVDPPEHVILASPLLHTDADGAIRHFQDSDRFVLDGKEISLPTFACSFVDAHDASSDGHGAQFPIRYSFGRSSFGRSSFGRTGAGSPGLVIIPITTDNDLQTIDDRVAGKIVLMGETDPSSWNDVHDTPLGLMPGALIHANILASARHHGLDWPVFLIGILIYAALGLVALLPWIKLRQTMQAGAGGQLRSPWVGIGALIAAIALALVVPIAVAGWSGHLEAAESIKLCLELVSVMFASFVFAAQGFLAPGLSKMVRLPHWVGWLVSFAVAAVVVVIGIAMMWFLLGAFLLSFGLLVGSLMPVIATCLEALIKAGQHVIDPIEHGLKRLNLRAVAVVLAAGFAGLTPALAADPLPPAAPSGESPGLFNASWQTFVELISGSPEAKSVRIGAGTRHRGGDDSVALQWLPTIPADGAALPVGAPGLALVWTGGKPPFLVSLESDSGTALGATTTDARILQLPGFVMPAEPVLVQVSDELGQPINARLRPTGAEPPPPRAATGRAIVAQMATSAPERRLDALRRLSFVARNDAAAAEAIALIQRNADVPP